MGYRKFLIGIGGSATNDAGLGAMQALGLRCYNSQGRVIKEPIKGSMLQDVTHLDLTSLKRKMADIELTIACDVQNPLFGPQGAASGSPLTSPGASSSPWRADGPTHWTRKSWMSSPGAVRTA